eukprot:sb/3473580/
MGRGTPYLYGGAIPHLILSQIGSAAPDSTNGVYISLMSVSYLLQQLCVCTAMRFGKPAKASLLKYFDIVLPLVFQVAIFRDTPNQYGLIGSGLIVAAVLTVILVGRPGKKGDAARPQGETLRDSEKLLCDGSGKKGGSARYTILDEVDD